MGPLNVVTKLLVLAWAGIAVLVAAAQAQLVRSFEPATAFVDFRAGFASPVLLLVVATAVWLVVDWRMGAARKARENQAILRDKPRLVNDPKALARERRIRRKEAALQKREVKSMRAENRAERRIVKETKREGAIERKREKIEARKDALRGR